MNNKTILIQVQLQDQEVPGFCINRNKLSRLMYNQIGEEYFSANLMQE